MDLLHASTIGADDGDTRGCAPAAFDYRSEAFPEDLEPEPAYAAPPAPRVAALALYGTPVAAALVGGAYALLGGRL